MLTKVINWAFYILFALTPLIWTSTTSELFEFNKMFFVYFATIVILSLWLIRMVSEKRLILKRTPLDIPIILFLLANILSTVFSTDTHLSVWGYYSRLNGGLLSTISYFLLYYAYVSNLEPKNVISSLKAALLGGIITATYAIPEHFGASPSCLFITGEFNANCWVQRVQERVFATLGQPNWLAAYLAMLIFPAVYFLNISKNLLLKMVCFLGLITFYMAFTFTYSRGAFVGLLAGLLVILAGIIIPKEIFTNRKQRWVLVNLLGLDILAGITAGYFTDVKRGDWTGFGTKLVIFTGALTIMQLLAFKSRSIFDSLKKIHNLPWLASVLVFFILTNLYFGSSLTRFKIFTESEPPQKVVSSGTQLENGGTESGQIRLIVWRGALEIFKHYPIFGSGVETFANSYYFYRPTEHNYTTEWDFLYNKAHNEFLNYLATTGLFGFLSYLFMIGAFIFWSIRFWFRENEAKLSIDNPKLLSIAILAGYFSYLVQNVFLFSVVAVALFFYLYPAIIFVTTDSVKEVRFPRFLNKLNSLGHFLVKKPLYQKTLFIIITLITITLIWKLASFYNADLLYNQGNKASSDGSTGLAYNLLSDAVTANPYEPLYQSELAYAAAGAALALQTDDSTKSAQLRQQAIVLTEDMTARYPKNVSIFRTAIRTYYLLSNIDPIYTQDALKMLDKAIALAPTDPKLMYNKAVILSQNGDTKEAEVVLDATINLKSDYTDAHYALGLIYFQNNQKDIAIEQMKQILQINPNYSEASDKLKLWQGR